MPVFSLMNALIVSIFILATTIAWSSGGPPERTAAVTIITWMGIDTIYHLIFGRSSFGTVDPVHVVLDTTELAALVWLALRANRMWVLVAAAAQLMCVTGHIAVLLESGGLRRAYWALTQMPQYIEIAALLAGVFAHDRRVRVIGNYRNWRKI